MILLIRQTHTKILCQNYAEKNIKKSKGVFIDMSFINLVSSNSYTQYSPTITRNGHMWCIPMHRKANVKELLKLQGFPTNFKYSVSDNEIKKQIGNSMSVNVLVEIFKLCFKHINF
jgi:site-specific DNA-cytosine methylase